MKVDSLESKLSGHWERNRAEACGFASFAAQVFMDFILLTACFVRVHGTQYCASGVLAKQGELRHSDVGEGDDGV